MRKTRLLSKVSAVTGYDYYPFLEMYKLIEWNRTQRKNENVLSNSLNYNLILLCTAMIEGVTSSIFNSVVEFRQFQLERELVKYRKEDLLRLLKELDEKLDRSFWREFPSIYQTIFGQNVKERLSNYDSELWKGIDCLFIFRNAIIHGNIITIEYHPLQGSDDVEIKVLGKYKKIYAYLSEKRLIDSDSVGMVYLMNDRIADHFIDKMQKFISLFIETIDSRVEKSAAINRIKYLFEEIHKNN